jgi:hypothetical protein
MEWDELYSKHSGRPKKITPIRIALALVIAVLVVALIYAIWFWNPLPLCTPSCEERCGQDDGCGFTCPRSDISACGKCGNNCTQKNLFPLP